MASGHTLFSGVPEVMPNAAGHARQTISPSADSFGSATARAGMELGGSIDKAAGTMLEADTARNTLQNEIHASETNTWFADAVTDKFQKFSEKRGKAALDALPEFKADVEGLYQQSVKSSGNLQTEAMVSKANRAISTRYYQYGTFHANREFKHWGDETAQRRASTFGAQAVIAMDNGDTKGMDTALHTSDDEVRKLAEQRGMDAEATSAMVMKNRGKNLKSLIEQKGNDDPVGASEMFKEYKSGMDPESQLHVKNFLRGKLTGVVAKGKVDELLGPETGASPQRKFESVLVGRESSHQPGKVNQLGYAGLYQFGAPRAADIGVYTPGPGENLSTWSKTPGNTPGKWTGTFNIPGHPDVKTLPQFLASPGAQRAAYGLHQQKMDREIEQNGLDRFIGQSVAGVPITREGLYAMMHLGGAGGAKRALESGGRDAATDANGTSVMDYARLGAAASMSPNAALPPKAVAYERAIDAAKGNDQVLNAMITDINRRYARAEAMSANSRVAFDARVKNTTVEYLTNGSAKNPLAETDFIGHLGLDEGVKAFRDYQKNAQFGTDVQAMAAMSPQETRELLAKYKPEDGSENFADEQKRYEALGKAAQKVAGDRGEDPAAFAAARLPVVGLAWKGFGDAMGNATMPFAGKQAMAADYAGKTVLEQQRLGVAPENIRIVPQGYVDAFNARVNSPATTGGSHNAAALIEQEARLWGDRWNDVYRQIAMDKGTAPIVRVIGSGINPQAAALLVELRALSAQTILKDQSAEKFSLVQAAVRDAMAPFAKTLAGKEGGNVLFHDFEGQAQKLAASYVATGEMTATQAADRAFNEMLGFKYEFYGAVRMPKFGADGKPTGLKMDEVQRGMEAASRKLDGQQLMTPADSFGGLSKEYLQRAPAGALKRDGVWVTAPGDAGVGLVWKGAVVLRPDGMPYTLSWNELTHAAKASAMETEDRPGDVARMGEARRGVLTPPRAQPPAGDVFRMREARPENRP